jgi:xylan 1,4-beta-xylosidase
MEWQTLGPVMDASLISDEGSTRNQFTFTGAFAAMAVFDITGQGAAADFDWFSYMPE